MLNKPRILVVEDESGIADTLLYVLASDGFTPVWCSTAQQALGEFAAELPALAILDVGLPDLNGFELFKRLQALPGGAQVPMLFLTARSDEIDRVVGLELGADDYVAKPFSPRELVARVRGILRRSVRPAAGAQAAPAAPSGSPPPGAQNAGPLAAAAAATSAAASVSLTGTAASAAVTALSATPFALDEERRQIRFYGRVLELSRYEYGILRLLVLRPGRVYTRDELLDRVWEGGSASLDRTIDAHIKTLRAKLKTVAPQTEPIRTSRGTGYALSEDLPPARE